MRQFRTLLALALVAVLAWGTAAAAACRSSEPSQSPDDAVAVSWEDPGRAAPRAGQPFALSWDARLSCDGPAYLVIALPERVRFTGEGFIALAPGEPAPYGIGFSQDRMRLAIPLHIEEARSGTANVTPYLVGDMPISWALVEPGKEPVTIRDGHIDIANGQPKIVVQDVYASEIPAAIRNSPNGQYVLEDFNGHFRVIDAVTGALVMAAEGYRPGFSPTSRFLAWFGNASSQLRVMDLYAEQQIVDMDPNGQVGRGTYVQGLLWSPGDTFLLIVHEARGALSFQETLNGRHMATMADGCGACDPLEDSTAVIDLDNSLASLGNPTFDSLQVFSLVFDRMLADEGFDDGSTDAAVLTHVRSAPLFARATVAGEAAWRLNGKFAATIDPLEGLPIFLGGPRATEERSEGEDEPQVVARATETETLKARGAASLAPKVLVNRRERIAQRLGALGIQYRYSAPLAFDKVEFESWRLAENEDYEYDPDDYRVVSGQVALARGLATPATAARIDQAVAPLTRDHDACIVNQAYNGKAQVWTWREKAKVRQIIQYYCYVSTGGYPEGIAFLVEGDDTGASVRLLGQTLDGDEDLDTGPADEADIETIAAADQDVAPDEIADIAFYDELRVFRPDENHIALLSARSELALVDMHSEQVVTVDPDIEAAANVEDITITPDGRHLVQINDDGRFFVVAVETGEAVLRGRFVDDEVVVYSNNFDYESTPDGARHVHLKFPGDRNLYELAQFDATLRADGLAARALSGSQSPSSREERSPGVPPRLALSAADQPDAAEATLNIVASGESRLSQLGLYRDGKLARTITLDRDNIDISTDIALFPETRSVAARIADEHGLTSLVANLAITPAQTAAPQGRLHVLAVGTDDYDDPAITDLAYARQDARNFAAAIAATASSYYGDVRTEVMEDTADMAHSLPARLKVLRAQMREGDTLFLHIAGHGMLDNGQLYLAGRDTRLDDIAGTAVSMASIADTLSSTPGRVFVFLDACHSGATEAATNDDAVQSLLSSSQSPIAVLSASKGRQVSIEGARYGGGAFTGLLTDILSKHLDFDANGNGVLDFDELYRALKRDVVAATNGRQTPWIARSGLVGDVPVY